MRGPICLAILLIASPAFSQHMPTYMTNGVRRVEKKQDVIDAPSPAAQAFIAEAIKGDSEGIKDDSWKPHLTVVGTAEEIERVRKDIEGTGILGKMNLKDSVHVHYFTPDKWQVRTVGLAFGGKPDIIVQQAADVRGYGRVIHRQRDYSGGEAALAKALAGVGVGAVRRPNPDHNPENDPGISGFCPLGFDPSHWPLIAVGAVAILYLLRPTKRG